MCNVRSETSVAVTLPYMCNVRSQTSVAVTCIHVQCHISYHISQNTGSNTVSVHPCLTESDADHHVRGLRPHRHVRAHWPRHAGLQLHRHGAASLERHAGQPTPTHRPMAHAAGGPGEELSHLASSSASWPSRLPSLGGATTTSHALGVTAVEHLQRLLGEIGRGWMLGELLPHPGIGTPPASSGWAGCCCCSLGWSMCSHLLPVFITLQRGGRLLFCFFPSSFWNSYLLLFLDSVSSSCIS